MQDVGHTITLHTPSLLAMESTFAVLLVSWFRQGGAERAAVTDRSLPLDGTRPDNSYTSSIRFQSGFSSISFEYRNWGMGERA